MRANAWTKKKKIILGLCIIVFVILGYVYWTQWRIERISIPTNRFFEEYSDYFYRTRRVVGRTLVGTTAHSQIIYFKPGQRRQMIERVRQDIINELEKLITEHSDIFYRYEIDDDFRRVRIYEVQGLDRVASSRRTLGPDVNQRISSLIVLYHNIRVGGRAGGFHQIVTFVPFGVDGD